MRMYATTRRRRSRQSSRERIIRNKRIKVIDAGDQRASPEEKPREAGERRRWRDEAGPQPTGQRRKPRPMR